MSFKRFDYKGLNKREFDLIVDGFKLNEPQKRADALQPELPTEQLVADFLDTFIDSRIGKEPPSLAQVGQLLQRMLWMEGEIKSLRRTNRNVRSKNRRLDKLRIPKDKQTLFEAFIEAFGDHPDLVEIMQPGYVEANPHLFNVKGVTNGKGS